MAEEVLDQQEEELHTQYIGKQEACGSRWQVAIIAMRFNLT